MPIRLLDVMHRSVSTVPSTATVAEAARLMGEKTLGCLVVADGSAVSGIVTERDLLLKVLAPGRDAASTQVSEVMTSPIITEGPETSLDRAVGLMAERRIRRLPIVKDGQLVGIVTSTDVLTGLQRALIQLAEEAAKAVQSASKPKKKSRKSGGARRRRR